MTVSATYRILATALLAAGCLLPLGCAPSDTSGPPAATKRKTLVEEVQSAETATPADNPAPALVMGDQKTLDQWLGEYRGNVVLVDFWATWCGPCVERMPHVVEMEKAHRDDGLKLITVSMDEPEDEAKVVALLDKMGAAGRHLLTRYGAGTAFAEAFDIPGDVPFYRLYDRTGKLRYQFSASPDSGRGTLPLDELDQHVAELLADNGKIQR